MKQFDNDLVNTEPFVHVRGISNQAFDFVYAKLYN